MKRPIKSGRPRSEGTTAKIINTHRYDITDRMRWHLNHKPYDFVKTTIKKEIKKS